MSRVFVSGVVVCLVCEPFKPRPVFGFFVWVPPSFCVWLVIVDAVFSLFFSFSQALGKPKPPSGGLGFPLCSLLPARGLRLRPVLRVPHVHLGEAPAPVFFFFPSPSFVFRFGVFLVFVLVVVGFLVVSMVLLWVVA